MTARKRSDLAVALLLALIVALGAGLRFWRIGQIPPGLHYDEAFNNLLALRLPERDPPPVFFDVEFGRSVLHPYLIALLFRFTGPIALGGRLVSATAGTLTVLLLFFATREMFQPHAGRERAARIGLLASLSLAVLYWHVHQSRIGMEMVLVPALIVPAFGAIWRALRTRRLRDAVLAGGLLGLTPYTYPTALFVPLLLILFYGGRVALERRFLRAHWRPLLTIVAVALLLVLPLVIFFLRHPGWLTIRSGQVLQPDYVQGSWKVLQGLFVPGAGDQNVRQNLPGRPILDLFQTALFLSGVIACLARRRPPHIFLLLWTAVMLAPSALTEAPPHARRMVGAAPAIAALVGLGAEAALTFMRGQVKTRAPQTRKLVRWGAILLLGLGFATSGVRTARDYFVRWARSDDLYIAFDVGLREIGEYAAARPPEERVYISPTDRFWKTLEFLLDGDPYRTHNYNGRRCVVYPARTRTPTHHVIVVLEDPNSLPTLRRVFPAGEIVRQWFMGKTRYAVAYRTPADQRAHFEPAHALEANFDDKIRLLGYDPPEGALSPGGTLSTDLYWLAQTEMTSDYKTFLHLVGPLDAAPRIWGQEDAHPCDNSYHTTWWAPGEVIENEHRIALSPDLPPGTYTLVAGLYQEGGSRLPVLDAGGAVIADHVTVTELTIQP